ncbi:hypothetical protein [Hymenobacter bucti]|uniref:YcxB family protein n=1 Tax=Hymenobacter bucti TaxID=1844114 RepID=A0ABW4R0U1_9BACT
MVSHITRRFQSDFAALLAGKLYTFRRRSVWRYLLAALLLSLARPTLVHNFWRTLLAAAAGLVGLGLLAVVASSYAQRRQKYFEAEIAFRADGLTVQPTSGALAEAHDWQWVRHASESRHRFYLVLRPFPRLVLLLDKHRLTAEEVAAFRTWLAARHPAR